MKTLAISLCLLAFLAAVSRGADDFLDRLDEALTVSAFHDNVRTRLSGLLDIEGYRLDQPAPGLIDTDKDFLFNPRLSLFLDSQIGSHIYVFAQARLDRGYDPSDNGAKVRLDEYAARWTPWEDGRFTLQAGKFSTIVGTWVARHLSWENPFINAPLPYENLTAVSDIEAPASAQEFLAGRKLRAETKYEHVPIIWGANYTSGISVAGRLSMFDYAAEIKNAALSSRPESWDVTDVGFEHPTVSGRLGYHPSQAWNFGISASGGSYLRSEAAASLPEGRDIGDYHEFVLGQDVSFAWHHLQLWAECYEARFQVPRVGNADTLAYYIEAKYKFAPQLFGAVRWNQQFFADVRNGKGSRASFGDDVWRAEAAIGYRFTPHTQLKVQYSLAQNDTGRSGCSNMVAAQFTVRF